MDLEGLCDNRTAMRARCARLLDRRGREVITTIAKQTFEVDAHGNVRLALPQAGIRPYDVPATHVPGASPRRPSDWFDEKPGTDVLLVGTAHPRVAGATHHDVEIRVECRTHTIRKVVRVHGVRVFYRATFGVVPGPSLPVQPTPLVYELAYGGVDEDDPERSAVLENPVGMGHARDPERLVGRPAPRLEDPDQAIGRGRGAPACFGPVAPGWEPRRSRYGTRDAAWALERAPVAPEDFDPRCHSVAPPGLWSETPLAGDEPVEVIGATPEGVWRFRLPRFAPAFTAVIRGDEVPLSTHLDTFLVDADLRTVEVTFRASVALPKRSNTLERIRIEGAPGVPRAMVDDLASRIRESGAAEESLA